MLFNSFTFIFFFAVTLTIYWSLKKFRWQNVFLLGCSLFFYGYGEPKFLYLIVICGLTGFLTGQAIERYPRFKKVSFITGTSIAIAILFAFKYYGFFTENIYWLLQKVGLPANRSSIEIILPIGISFFTFQTVGYIIDVYKGICRAEKNLVDFLLFVTFFPQLVAGPIERADHFIPQIKKQRYFGESDLVWGVYYIFQGLIKKVIIADNIAPIVNLIFDNPSLSAPMLIAGLIGFTFQIYGDFSGYSDIARGTARLMGFKILLNFHHPYISRTPSEFWQRWHITLSSWYRDYVYISLGGNRKGLIRTFANLMFTMVLCGLWHGASFNFMLWGAYHGGLLILHRLFTAIPFLKPLREAKWYDAFAWASFFILTVYGWMLFRVTSLPQIVDYTHALFSDWSQGPAGVLTLAQLLPFILICILIDRCETLLTNIKGDMIQFRWRLLPYLSGLLLLFYLLVPESSGDFLYFKF